MWVIDFEASGLSKQSYPIEVGLTNGEIEYSALIKPMDHWRHWDYSAQAIHHIGRPNLVSDGKNAAVVASELLGLIGSDLVQWDGFWLNVLLSDNSQSKIFQLLDIKDLLDDFNVLEVYLKIKETMEKSGDYTLHRALDDARIIWHSLQGAKLIK